MSDYKGTEYKYKEKKTCKCGYELKKFITTETLPKQKGYYRAAGLSPYWDNSDCLCIYIFFDGEKFHNKSNYETESNWGDMSPEWSAYEYDPLTCTQEPDENKTYRPEDFEGTE